MRDVSHVGRSCPAPSHPIPIEKKNTSVPCNFLLQFHLKKIQKFIKKEEK